MFDLDMLDAEILGEYDIAAHQRQLNTLKQVTVSIGRALLRGGQQVARQTIKSAQGGWFERELPGLTSLKKTQGHLDWHAAELAKQSDPTAIYAPGQDLKKWVMQAFIDSNAIEEGRAYQEQIWQDMWTEIGEELAKLPARTVAFVAETAGTLTRAAGSGLAAGLGIPPWLFWTGGAVALGAVGLGTYKLVMLAAPAMASVAARRYLP